MTTNEAGPNLEPWITLVWMSASSDIVLKNFGAV